MSGGYRLDSDGDVEMSFPQPVYEFITAPKLKSWTKLCVLRGLPRKRYEVKIAERCAVTDAELVNEVMNRCSNFKNAHVPDLDRLFREKLKMILRIDDCDARILHYFAEILMKTAETTE
ncbi:hypothetical protein PF001_g3577 [Phytophthora fragariae]|uniref:Uncharacterized protein n=1 Tax=Phytophthora fragariae TaxID=53985 RepID=A0A6A4EKQ7_9STRA|nr:hypothetical protein PF001_g3577 [Phytophthora fragariae]